MHLLDGQHADGRLQRRKSLGDDMRFMLYSHDSWGLGHLRRNLVIADQLLREFPRAGVLLVTGSPCPSHFPVPRGAELIKIPAITKDGEGRYVPRNLPGGLGRSVGLRSELLLAAFRAFAPQVIVVDHQLLGLAGELIPTLREAKRTGVSTVLGVRDIIDAPEAVAREWGTKPARWALAEVYDRICVYGSPLVFDPRREYPIPSELRERLEFTGYLASPRQVARRRSGTNGSRHVLVTAGGGEDGSERIETYLDALALGPVGWSSTIVLGPLMAPASVRRIKRRAAGLPSVEVRRFHADVPQLLADSDAVVSMAGYNTSVEVLQAGLPCVMLPRSHPRVEQVLRARNLERLGFVRCLTELDASRLRSSVESCLQEKPAPALALPLDGVSHLSRVVRELVCGEPESAVEEPKGALRERA